MQLYLPIADIPVNVFLILAMGAAVGFVSGMFGIGGGFLMTPLLIFVGIAPAVAVGNTVIAIPSEVHPLAATELYTVLEASDVPAGVINIVTGDKDALAKVLAEHDDVDVVWYFGNQAASAEVERASAGNMKRTWVEWHPRDWNDNRQGEGREFLRGATQVKNIWIPYGE